VRDLLLCAKHLFVEAMVAAIAAAGSLKDEEVSPGGAPIDLTSDGLILRKLTA